jgi:hypothetical protein
MIIDGSGPYWNVFVVCLAAGFIIAGLLDLWFRALK